MSMIKQKEISLVDEQSTDLDKIGSMLGNELHMHSTIKTTRRHFCDKWEKKL